MTISITNNLKTCAQCSDGSIIPRRPLFGSTNKANRIQILERIYQL